MSNLWSAFMKLSSSIVFLTELCIIIINHEIKKTYQQARLGVVLEAVVDHNRVQDWQLLARRWIADLLEVEHRYRYFYVAFVVLNDLNRCDLFLL